MICLVGPSKVGKTVLTNHLSKERDRIFITCGSIKDLDTFYKIIFETLALPIEITESQGSSNTDSYAFTSTLKLKVSQVFASLGLDISASNKHDNTNQKSTTQKFSLTSIISAVDRVIKGSNIVVILDDFHYIKSELQKEIIKIIKGWLTEDNCVIATLVGHRQGMIIDEVPEIKGRAMVIPINSWTDDELKNIVVSGLESLKVNLVPNQMIDSIIKESYSNPMLTQEICKNLCYEKGIFYSNNEFQELEISKDELEAIFRESANSMIHENRLDGFEKGKNPKGTERIIYQYLDGKERDIYQSIMYYLKLHTTISAIKGEDIAVFLYNNMDSGTKDLSYIKTSVKKTLSHIVDLDIRSLDNEDSDSLKIRLVDYVKDNDEFYILDPHFAFYLKWNEKEY